jgi:hypothetical protein
LTITSTSYTTHSNATFFALYITCVFLCPSNIQLSKISIAPAIGKLTLANRWILAADERR